MGEGRSEKKASSVHVRGTIYDARNACVQRDPSVETFKRFDNIIIQGFRSGLFLSQTPTPFYYTIPECYTTRPQINIMLNTFCYC